MPTGLGKKSISMAGGVQLDAMLVRTPNVCGGRLRIGATRVTVLQISSLYKRGESAEEIAQNFPQLNLGQVYAALAYYHENRAEVEQELADVVAEFDRLKSQSAQGSKSP
jgi:uncharacterized protein (DUF433 family)